jgi:drug/metabolite transporter (DMT)-like permease
MAATTASQWTGAAKNDAQGSRRQALLLLALANILWAGTYTAGKIALRDLSPVELNALRFLLATLILSPVLLRGWRQIPRDRATLFMLAQLALFGWILNKTLEYVGLNLSTASDTALLISTESLFTALLSWILLREHVRTSGILSLGIGLLGAYLIVERGFIPTLSGGGGAARIVGDVLIVLSLLVEATYTVRGKAAVARLSPLLFTSATIAGSLVFWLPAGAVNIVHSGLPQLSLSGWLAMLYMAAVATATCYWLWFRGLRSVDGSAAAPMLFIQPLVGAALAVWLLHEQLSWATLLGGALIAASLLLVLWNGSRPDVVLASESTP